MLHKSKEMKTTLLLPSFISYEETPLALIPFEDVFQVRIESLLEILFKEIFIPVYFFILIFERKLKLIADLWVKINSKEDDKSKTASN